MSRLFFAWELGANLGHLSRDLVLARACRDAGHHIVMAVANLRTAASLFSKEGFTLVQAPLLKPTILRPHPPINYADMLLHEGYDDVAALTAALEGWDGLFELAQPDLLIYNHAPTALIAARVRNLPVLLLGTGFEIPPTVSPLPSFRPWQAIPQEVLQHPEQQLLLHINPQLTSVNKTNKDQTTPALHSLSALFEQDEIYLTTFAELDPFGPRLGLHYLGPLYALPHNIINNEVYWLNNNKQHIFAYLRPSIKSCEQLLAALQATKAEVICAIPGLPPEWQSRYPRLRLFAHAVDLKALLPQADLVLTYGAGTISTALLAGVPVMLIPQMVEQYLHGNSLETIGAGMILKDQSSTEACLNLMHKLLSEPDYKQAAQAFSQRHIDFSMEMSCKKLLDVIRLKLDNPE